MFFFSRIRPSDDVSVAAETRYVLRGAKGANVSIGHFDGLSTTGPKMYRFEMFTQKYSYDTI